MQRNTTLSLTILQFHAELHKKIEMLLQEGKSYTTIMHLINCSRGTIAKIATRLKSLE